MEFSTFFIYFPLLDLLDMDGLAWKSRAEKLRHQSRPGRRSFYLDGDLEMQYSLGKTLGSTETANVKPLPREPRAPKDKLVRRKGYISSG